ncbi:MAG: nucleotide exchange factor GrpE [Deltaproteobacteria bacterium]|nr:nucleotide exchange factor GrpE [Deltaproteobacteria bacterium]
MKEEESQATETKREEAPKEESLEQKLQRAEQELQESKNRLLYLQAEFENYRKRMVREKAEFLNYGTEQILKELLPLLDDLERTLEHAKSHSDLSGLVQGVELVVKKFHSIFENMGVRPISTVGQKFDPLNHEAIGKEERADIEPGTVIQEVERGYRLKDRLLRAARVTIATEPKMEGTEH